MTTAVASKHNAIGGKTVYGARVGILMLETRFPRLPGDIGHAATWPFPVLYKVVTGATGDRVTTAKRNDYSTGLLEAFIDAGQELVRTGADALTTSCGFLSIYQDVLAEKCGVPVATSALLQVSVVQRLLPPGQRVGVLTFDASRLGSEHLEAAGAPLDTPVVGTQNGHEFWRVMRDSELELDVEAAQADILTAGEELATRYKNIGAIVLECTNMVPFSPALASRLRLPIYDVRTLITWFHAGLEPYSFDLSTATSRRPHRMS